MHGGDIYSDKHPAGRDLIDFSSNSNPYGPPDEVKNNLAVALEHALKYPDIEYRLLKKEIQNHHNLRKANIVLGNGAGEIIDLAIKRVNSLLILNPAYSEYEESAIRYDIKVFHSEYKHCNIEGKKYCLEINGEDFWDKFYKADAVVLAHPNNPDGNVLTLEKMRKIVDFARKNKKKLIIDETFFDYTNEQVSFTSFLEEEVDLIVIKAITKFYGLPGIRFGYGLCSDKNIVEEITNFQRPWNINAFAEKFAVVCFKDEKYKENMTSINREERDWMTNELIKLKNIKRVYISEGNYILLVLQNIKAGDLKKRLIEKGILIRNCDNYKGLNEYSVRVAVKKREDNIKLLKEMEDLLQ
ncbi:MAG: pyridoxal phosphate-dependent aminotransferase [Alkaliphilus sp.]